MISSRLGHSILLFATEQAYENALVTLATGLKVEIEGKFLFMDTGKRDGSVIKPRQKERLVRFVGVICTNRFKIGTGSHNVAFTFISFLKRKRKRKKNENVSSIAI